VVLGVAGKVATSHPAHPSFDEEDHMQNSKKDKKKILGWHFTNGMVLRDGQPLKVGKTYKYVGTLEMCARGYHASEDIRDALSYGPGFQVSRVECSGDMEKQDDKLVCRNRKVLWTLDAKKIILKWSIRVTTDAVKTAKKVCNDKAWNAWTDLWISGKDRTHAAAYAAYAAANAAAHVAHAAYAAYAAANAAADAAANAANAAAHAAAYAAYAAAKKKYSGWLVSMIEKVRTP
jgi:hypothetical protein